MKKISAYLTLSLLVAALPALAASGPIKGIKSGSRLNVSRSVEAVPAQGGGSVWKSQDEYNAYQTMNAEKDPKKKIELGEAFLQKFTDSGVKNYVYAAMMNAYQQLGDTAKASETARKILEIDANNLDALRYLSFVFPFTFKADSPDAQTELSRADSDAHHGLEVLGKVAKPANVSDEQFNQAIKPVREIFNNAIGFVALQRKDYAAAITSFKAGLEDNPSDLYATNWLGTAYLYSTPPDYNHALWYLARAASLAKATQGADEKRITDFLMSTYACYHGSTDGLDALEQSAASGTTPPSDLSIASLQAPAATGNPNVDNFASVTYRLKVQGCPSIPQQTWTQLKGQPLGLGGFVNSVEKGEDAGTYVVKIALDQAKASTGFDIQLKDSTQPKAGDLSEGDPVRFQGTISAYSNDPAFSLTLDNGKINDDDLEAASAKTKASPRRKRASK